MQTAKEKVANVGASAKSGMEKTKATAQEKVDKMTAHDPMSKEMAREKKEARIQEAELEKQREQHHNAAAKASAGTTTTGHGLTGHTTGHTGGTTGHTFGQGGY